MNDLDQMPSVNQGAPDKEPVRKKIFKNRWFRIAFGLSIGAFAGVLYWNFIGCTGGTCPLTSNPTNTIVLFTVMGGWMSYK